MKPLDPHIVRRTAIWAFGLVALPLIAVACSAHSDAQEPPPSVRTAPYMIECDYDPVSPRELVDICHDTANAVGGEASTPGPYVLIRTNERGCVHGHAEHARDFTLPPGVAVPDPNNPCACGPEGASLPLGGPKCCGDLALVPVSDTEGVCLAAGCRDCLESSCSLIGATGRVAGKQGGEEVSIEVTVDGTAAKGQFSLPKGVTLTGLGTCCGWCCALSNSR